MRECVCPPSERNASFTFRWCTQADLDRGCKQMRECVCPPSERKASMKVAMKNQEKSVGVKYAKELQVGGEWCTQADLDRGCEQWRACLCPPSEGKASMKVAMKNQEKSVGVTYEEVSPYGTCYLEQATYSDCLAGHDKHIE